MTLRRLIIVFVLFSSGALYSADRSVFEDLDKPPEGAYAGQIFAGASLGMGLVSGSIIKAEKDFVSGTTYSFEDSEVTKKVELQHYSFAFSMFGEYMPLDHFGVKGKISRAMVAQKSTFGADYPNEQGFLLKTWNITFAPVYHVTVRREWDVTIAPFLGYSIGTFNAIPVAKGLFDTIDSKTSQSSNSLIYGIEINGTLYFSGGFFLSLGAEWTRYNISIDNDINRTSPSALTYNNGSKSGNIDTYIIQISAGYAFRN
ncbi:MAG TPA: hypothetical protein PLA54_07785 [Spirochaetota bacterium]|nr:hypothetical protein [Spirochaetota bacterium]